MLLTAFDADILAMTPTAQAEHRTRALRVALSEFFRRSTCWRERFKSAVVSAGKATYDLGGLSDNPVCAITDMKLLSTQAPIDPATEAEMVLHHGPAWKLATGQAPKKYVPLGPSRVTLFPIPEVTEDRLDVELALYVSPSTTEIPDWIGEMYRDDIVAGAVGELQRMPGREWTSHKLGEEAHERLLIAAGKARVRIEKSNTRRKQIASFTNFDDL